VLSTEVLPLTNPSSSKIYREKRWTKQSHCVIRPTNHLLTRHCTPLLTLRTLFNRSSQTKTNNKQTLASCSNQTETNKANNSTRKHLLSPQTTAFQLSSSFQKPTEQNSKSSVYSVRKITPGRIPGWRIFACPTEFQSWKWKPEEVQREFCRLRKRGVSVRGCPVCVVSEEVRGELFFLLVFSCGWF